MGHSYYVWIAILHEKSLYDLMTMQCFVSSEIYEVLDFNNTDTYKCESLKKFLSPWNLIDALYFSWVFYYLKFIL